MKGKRIGFDELYMLQVRAYAMRSSCEKYKVGAVFARNNAVLTGGYNGSPKGQPNCCEVGCAKRKSDGSIMPAGSCLCRGAHAEMNSMANACRNGGVDLNGATVYCSFSPCLDCTKHLLNLGIVRFVYEVEYSELEGLKAIALLKGAGVETVRFSFDKSTLSDFVNFNSIIKGECK